MKGDIPLRFTKGVEAIKSLQYYPRYQAAFIFGSVAEGTSTAKSDLDVRVLVDQDNDCQNVNHPMFDEYKMDLSFRSFAQIKLDAEKDFEKRERRPILATSKIIFDKTGEITNLQSKARQVEPERLKGKDYLFIQFMLYHANDKVERYIEEDPPSALYSMHANIGDILKYHYRLNGRWWVSSKRILDDLETWDAELAGLLKKFVATPDVRTKYSYWSAIIDHVTAQMGGRQPIAENNCDCNVCKVDMATLMGESG